MNILRPHPVMHRENIQLRNQLLQYLDYLREDEDETIVVLGDPHVTLIQNVHFVVPNETTHDLFRARNLQPPDGVAYCRHNLRQCLQSDCVFRQKVSAVLCPNSLYYLDTGEIATATKVSRFGLFAIILETLHDACVASEHSYIKYDGTVYFTTKGDSITYQHPDMSWLTNGPNHLAVNYPQNSKVYDSRGFEIAWSCLNEIVSNDSQVSYRSIRFVTNDMRLRGLHTTMPTCVPVELTPYFWQVEQPEVKKKVSYYHMGVLDVRQSNVHSVSKIEKWQTLSVEHDKKILLIPAEHKPIVDRFSAGTPTDATRQVATSHVLKQLRATPFHLPAIPYHISHKFVTQSDLYVRYLPYFATYLDRVARHMTQEEFSIDHVSLTRDQKLYYLGFNLLIGSAWFLGTSVENPTLFSYATKQVIVFLITLLFMIMYLWSVPCRNLAKRYYFPRGVASWYSKRPVINHGLIIELYQGEAVERPLRPILNVLRDNCVLDPLTCEIIRDPMVLNNRIYDLDTIVRLVESKDPRDPFTREEISYRDVEPLSLYLKVNNLEEKYKEHVSDEKHKDYSESSSRVLLEHTLDGLTTRLYEKGFEIIPSDLLSERQEEAKSIKSDSNETDKEFSISTIVINSVSDETEPPSPICDESQGEEVEVKDEQKRAESSALEVAAQAVIALLPSNTPTVPCTLLLDHQANNPLHLDYSHRFLPSATIHCITNVPSKDYVYTNALEPETKEDSKTWFYPLGEWKQKLTYFPGKVQPEKLRHLNLVGPTMSCALPRCFKNGSQELLGSLVTRYLQKSRLSVALMYTQLTLLDYSPEFGFQPDSNTGLSVDDWLAKRRRKGLKKNQETRLKRAYDQLVKQAPNYYSLCRRGLFVKFERNFYSTINYDKSKAARTIFDPSPGYQIVTGPLITNAQQQIVRDYSVHVEGELKCISFGFGSNLTDYAAWLLKVCLAFRYRPNFTNLQRIYAVEFDAESMDGSSGQPILMASLNSLGGFFDLASEYEFSQYILPAELFGMVTRARSKDGSVKVVMSGKMNSGKSRTTLCNSIGNRKVVFLALVELFTNEFNVVDPIPEIEIKSVVEGDYFNLPSWNNSFIGQPAPPYKPTLRRNKVIVDWVRRWETRLRSKVFVMVNGDDGILATIDVTIRDKFSKYLSEMAILIGWTYKTKVTVLSEGEFCSKVIYPVSPYSIGDCEVDFAWTNKIGKVLAGSGLTTAPINWNNGRTFLQSEKFYALRHEFSFLPLLRKFSQFSSRHRQRATTKQRRTVQKWVYEAERLNFKPMADIDHEPTEMTRQVFLDRYGYDFDIVDDLHTMFVGENDWKLVSVSHPILDEIVLRDI